MTDDLRAVIGNVMFGDDFSAIALSPFVTLLIDTTTNLTNAGLDHDLIAAISGTANSSVVGTIQLLKEAQELFPQTTQEQNTPVLQKLENIIPVLQQLLLCTGANTPDCVGLIQLYHGLEDTALGVVSEMTGLIPDLTPGAVDNPFTTLTQLLTKVVDGINLALTTGDTTDLLLHARLLNRLIGTVSGNTGTFGSAANALTLLYISAQDALECVGKKRGCRIIAMYEGGYDSYRSLTNLLIYMNAQGSTSPSSRMSASPTGHA